MGNNKNRRSKISWHCYSAVSMLYYLKAGRELFKLDKMSKWSVQINSKFCWYLLVICLICYKWIREMMLLLLSSDIDCCISRKIYWRIFHINDHRSYIVSPKHILAHWYRCNNNCVHTVNNHLINNTTAKIHTQNNNNDKFKKANWKKMYTKIRLI